MNMSTHSEYEKSDHPKVDHYNRHFLSPNKLSHKHLTFVGIKLLHCATSVEYETKSKNCNALHISFMIINVIELTKKLGVSVGLLGSCTNMAYCALHFYPSIYYILSAIPLIINDHSGQ